jgi:polyisoprenoid-binding protein YceI
MSSAQPDQPTTNVTVAAMLADGSAAGTWELDPAASTIAFAVKHFWGLITVRGTFSRYTGHATVDPSGTIAADLTIDADSLDTKHKQRDKHLRSGDFFDIADHPSVTFTTTGTTTGAAPGAGGQFHIAGTLTAAGHSEPLEFDAGISEATAQAAVTDVHTDVDRTRFGMTWSPLHMAAPIAHVDLHLRWNKTSA